MKDEKVEIEEYWENGEVQIKFANGIVIFCTPRGKEIMDNLLVTPPTSLKS